MQLAFQCIPYAELTLDQLYTILQLRTEVFIVEQFCPYQDADDKDQVAYHLLGYDAGGILQGYARLLPPDVSYPDYSSIGRVIVAPAARGHGLGYILMQTALDALAERFPAQTCKLSAQAHLQAFYASFGFTQVGEGYLEDGIPHLPMVVRLPTRG